MSDLTEVSGEEFAKKSNRLKKRFKSIISLKNLKIEDEEI